MSEKTDKVFVQCFVCQKDIERESLRDDHVCINPVHGGLVFRATGNYGSTIFDPLGGGEFIEIYICDKCVEDQADSIKHVSGIVKEVVQSKVSTLAENNKAEEQLYKNLKLKQDKEE